jgi:hypothetical protein
VPCVCAPWRVCANYVCVCLRARRLRPKRTRTSLHASRPHLSYTTSLSRKGHHSLFNNPFQYTTALQDARVTNVDAVVFNAAGKGVRWGDSSCFDFFVISRLYKRVSAKTNAAATEHAQGYDLVVFHCKLSDTCPWACTLDSPFALVASASHNLDLARACRHWPRDDVSKVDLLLLRSSDLTAEDEVVR